MKKAIERDINHVRLDQIMTVNLKFAPRSACPFCLTMISAGRKQIARARLDRMM